MADPTAPPRPVTPSRVTKAVIPAAGLGTRFLPATKATPKEMLPVVDMPAIQYVVEEAVRAGLDDVLMITGRSKRALEDHFDRMVELEHTLEAKGDEKKLALVRAAGDNARDAVLAPLLAGARVAAYASFGTEPRTSGLVTPQTLLPVLRPDRDLDWAAGGVGLGLDAVADCDLVLVPALAVDPRGVRLGRGGGSYDRALVRARGLVVALLHEGELLEEPLPAEPHDVPVHAVATPSGLVRLR